MLVNLHLWNFKYDLPPPLVLKSKANGSRGGWWSFKRSKTAIILWRYNVFHSLREEKKKKKKKTPGIHVSTKLVKSGLCLSRRPHNNLIALPLSHCSWVKPLLSHFHQELHVFRSDKCCDFFVILNEPLSCILTTPFHFGNAFPF